MIPERLTALREEMKRRSIDIYVVPTADFHESEYVGEHFKARKFITGFTGSAGTAVITLKEAGLWTDGRYFVQAEKQLEGSTVTLYRMAEEGVPAVEEFVKDKLPQGGCIGFDGRTVNGAWGEKFVAIAEEKKGSLFVGEDLINLIWTYPKLHYLYWKKNIPERALQRRSKMCVQRWQRKVQMSTFLRAFAILHGF